jgi:hypothetical protein
VATRQFVRRNLLIVCGFAAAAVLTLCACNPLLTDPVSLGGELEMTSVRYAGQPAAWLEVAVTGAGDDSVYAFAVIPGSDVQGPSERDCAGAGDSTVACVITPSDLRMPDQRVVPGDGSAFVRMITVWPRERVDVVLVCVDPRTQNLGCADAVRTSLRTVDGAGALTGNLTNA